MTFCLCSFARAEPTLAEIQTEIDKTLTDKLGLTHAQLKDIQAEQKKAIADRKTLAAQEDTKRAELKTELEKVNSDQAVVDTLVTELNTIRADVIDLRVKSVKALKTILDKDQYKKVVEIQKKEKDEKVEKKKKVDEKFDKWKEDKGVKKEEKTKWYYYYW